MWDNKLYFQNFYITSNKKLIFQEKKIYIYIFISVEYYNVVLKENTTKTKSIQLRITVTISKTDSMLDHNSV